MSAFTGFTAEFEELVSGLVYEPGPSGVVARALRDGEVVHVKDMLVDPDAIDRQPARRSSARAESEPTWACRSGTAPR